MAGCEQPAKCQEGIMRTSQAALLSVAVAAALIAAPLSPASARGRHFFAGPFFPLAVAGAVVAGVATLVTAPVALATAPFRAPYYYGPPPGYYPPAPGYYYPAQPYAAPQPYPAPPSYYPPSPYGASPGYPPG
jgi:hypothetical protein